MSTQSGGSLEPLVEALRKKVKHLDSRADGHDDEIQDLQEQVAVLRQRVTALEDGDQE
jgi:hypothetical protein